MIVEYFLTDHLSSTSMILDSSGAKVSEMRYKAWGELRYTWTTSQTTTPSYKLTMYTYTGQANDSYINLLWDEPYVMALLRATPPIRSTFARASILVNKMGT